MLFQTFNPYNDDKNCVTQNMENHSIYFENKADDAENCFICYENKEDDKINPISLNYQIFYLKNCDCDGVIHKECLDNWFKIQKKCPVCRNAIIKNEYIIIKMMNHNKYSILFYVYYKKNINKVNRFLLYIVFLFFILNSYIYLIQNLQTFTENKQDDLH
jgi:hypothetical protein